MMMTSDHVTYLLNSAAWFVGGVIPSLIYMRWFYHRLLRREGLAKKEPPLSTFTAIIVGLVSIVGLLYSVSAQVTAKHAADKARAVATQTAAVATRNAQVAACINAALDQRNKVSDTPALTEFAQASEDFAKSLLGLFALPKNPTPAQQQAETDHLRDEITAYSRHTTHAVTVLVANAAYRAAHPLGKC